MTVLMLIMLAGACQSVDRSETEEEIAGSVSLYLAAGYTGAGSIGVPSLDHAQGPVYDRIRAFRQRYPEIVLEFGEYHYLGGSTFPDEFPDVIEITPYQARWVAENELQELGSTVSAWSADQTGGYAEVIERMKIGGLVWLLPLKVEPMVAYYDETVFAHLGIQTPHDHWTWDDFLAASRQLAQYGYVTDMPDTFEAAEPIIKGLGGSYTSPDGAVFTGYLNGAATIAAFEQYLSILNETRTEGKGAGDTPALGIAWPSELYPILKDHADIRIARLPVFSDGNRYNSMFATGLAMHSGARDKTAALELMKAVLDVQDRRLLRFVNAHALTAREPRYKTDARLNGTICWMLWRWNPRSHRRTFFS